MIAGRFGHRHVLTSFSLGGGRGGGEGARCHGGVGALLGTHWGDGGRAPFFFVVAHGGVVSLAFPFVVPPTFNRFDAFSPFGG